MISLGPYNNFIIIIHIFELKTIVECPGKLFSRHAHVVVRSKTICSKSSFRVHLLLSDDNAHSVLGESWGN